MGIVQEAREIAKLFKKKDWITILIILVGVFLYYLFFSGPGNRTNKTKLENSASVIEVSESADTTIKVNSDNTTYDYNEFPKPTLTYDVQLPSQIGDDGLYHSSYRVKIQMVIGMTIPSVHYDTGILTCREVDEMFNEGDWRGPHSYGTYTEQHLFIKCTSVAPLENNSKLFWL